MRIPPAEPTWVAELEIGEGLNGEGLNGEGLNGIAGPPRDDHRVARVLVRLHGTPLSFVTVPIDEREPERLLERVRGAVRQPLSGTSDHDSAEPSFIPPITVVICTRDRPDQLERCLRHCAALSYPCFEVLVVDNAPSHDGTRKAFQVVAGEDARFRYVEEPRAGLSNARNRGLEEAKFDLVAYTDDDVFVDREWLKGIARGFARDKSVCCVTGFVAPAALDTPAQHYMARASAWPATFEPRLFDLDSNRAEVTCYPFCAGIFGAGANFALDRREVLAMGGFDPLLGAGSAVAGGEDLDMFVRVVYEGHSIAYEPSAIVWHFHRADEADLARQLHGWGTGLGAYLTKQVLSRPMRGDLVRKVPRISARVAGAFLDELLRKLPARTKAKDDPTAPPATMPFSLIELRGMLLGALTYLRCRARRP